jgi:hypothetical protein
LWRLFGTGVAIRGEQSKRGNGQTAVRLAEHNVEPAARRSRRSYCASLVIGRSDIALTRFEFRGRHCRRLAQHIAAASLRLDVVTAAGCLGKLLAQLANVNVDDLGCRFVNPPVKVVEKRFLCQDGPLPQAEKLDDAIFLRGSSARAGRRPRQRGGYRD